MLVKVQILDLQADYDYARPSREGLVQTEEIASVQGMQPYAYRGHPCTVRVSLRNGEALVVVAEVKDFEKGGKYDP
jgi:hypothetical protein